MHFNTFIRACFLRYVLEKEDTCLVINCKRIKECEREIRMELFKK